MRGRVVRARFWILRYRVRTASIVAAKPERKPANCPARPAGGLRGTTPSDAVMDWNVVRAQSWLRVALPSRLNPPNAIRPEIAQRLAPRKRLLSRVASSTAAPRRLPMARLGQATAPVKCASRKVACAKWTMIAVKGSSATTTCAPRLLPRGVTN